MNKEKILEIQEKIDQKILNFLGYKARSISEVGIKLDYYLKRFKYLSSPEKAKIKENALKKLRELNLLDDDLYVKAYITEKVKSSKPVSKLQIKKFLFKKGISYQVIEKHLSLFTNKIEYSKVERDAKRKLRSYRIKDKGVIRRKLRMYLIQKGYPVEIVYSVVDNMTGVK